MAYINRRSFLAGTAATAFSSLLRPAGAYAQGSAHILIRGSNIFDGSSAELITGMDRSLPGTAV